jgi:methylmalonyl-CoA mutase N-terminal domain/subunit
MDAGEEVVVGVNRFTNDDPLRPELLKIDTSLERTRAERLAQLRSSRDESAAEAALTALESAARGEANLMPRILDAVEARCTVGGIADRLRAVFGVHRDEFTF